MSSESSDEDMPLAELARMTGSVDPVKEEEEQEEEESSDSEDEGLSLAQLVKDASATPSSAAVVDDDDDDDSDDEDSEEDMPLSMILDQAKAKKAQSKSPVASRKRSRVKQQSDDEADDDDDDDGDDDDDDDDDYVDDKPSKAKKRKTTATAAAAAKKKKAAAAKTKKATVAKKKKKTTTTTKAKAKAGAKKGKAGGARKRSGGAKKESGASPSKAKKVKPEPEPVREWWNEPPLPKGVKWMTLEHQGVLFAPPYEPHGVKMLYDGEPVTLTPEQEEAATFYARYIKTDHVKKPQFRKNFFKDFLKLLNPRGSKEKHVIRKFSKCDFTPIWLHLDAEKEKRKKRTKEEKRAEAALKAADVQKYGYAIMDGWKERISNFRVEPPGLFLGRGKHPKTGTIKKRIKPEQVTLNLGKGAPIPPCPIEGHKWGKIVTKQDVTWLAMWRENINGDFKYVMLHPSSKLKGMSDMAKFDKARRLDKRIKSIRKTYMTNLTSADAQERQLALAVWMVDTLALRAGNEKNTDSHADTVGCCSLRVEHVKLQPEDKVVVFDFLGKDSMRYFNEVDVPSRVFKAFQACVKGKSPSEQLLNMVSTGKLNTLLKSLMPGLTAKVFRTYNASITLQQELRKTPTEGTVEEKVLFYNRANREVAILCNHKRSLPASHSEMLERVDKQISEEKRRLRALKKHLKALKSGTAESGQVFVMQVYKLGEYIDREVKLPASEASCRSTIEKCEARIHKLNIGKMERVENAEVALGTSKINYNDPRITVAWSKRYDVPIEKVFAATLRAKFPWAQMADEKWTF